MLYACANMLDIVSWYYYNQLCICVWLNGCFPVGSLLLVEACNLLGMSNLRVPVIRSGTGTYTNLYPSAGMSFLTSAFFFFAARCQLDS